MFQIKRLINTVLAGLLVLGSISFGSKQVSAAIEVDPYNTPTPISISFGSPVVTTTVLGSPIGLKVEKLSNTSTLISWNAVEGAEIYHVKRDGEDIVVGTSRTNFVDDDVFPGTTYEYSVSAATEDDSVISEETKITFEMPKAELETPQNFREEDVTTTGYTLKWDAVLDAEYYIVEETTGKRPLYEAHEGTELVIDDLEPGTEHHYFLWGVNNTLGITSTYGATLNANTFPENEELVWPPTDFTVTNLTYNSVSFRWDGKAENYELKRDGEIVYRGRGKIFTDENLKEDTWYSYSLRAETVSGYSSPLLMDVLTPSKDEPNGGGSNDPEPPNEKDLYFNTISKTSRSIFLRWYPVLRADGYRVSLDGEQIYEGPKTNLSIEDLTPKTEYTVTLSAYNEAGSTSTISEIVKTASPPLEGDLNAKASRIASNYVTLEWSNIVNAEKYEVFRSTADERKIVYSGPMTTFVDNTVSPRTHYDYSVIADNDAGSKYSRGIHVITLEETPPLTVVKPEAQTENTITFTFKLVDDAEVYYVERNPRVTYTERPDGNFDTDYYNTVTGEERDLGITVPNADGMITFKEEGLTAGTAYHYDVTAVEVNARGDGEVVGQTSVEAETSPASDGGTPGDDDGDGDGSTPGDNDDDIGNDGGTGDSDEGNTGGNGNTGSSGSVGTIGGGVPVGSGSESGRFSDITGHWAEDAINHLAEQAIITGDGNKFYPDRTVTRAEFTAMVVRAFDKVDENSKISFEDVTEDKWYYDAVNTGATLGFVDGVGPMKFDPNAPVTRQEMATILGRIGKKLGLTATEEESAAARKKFVDGDTIADWASPYVGLLVVNKAITGVSDATFVPKKKGTRAESAVLIYRMLEKVK